MKTFLKYTACLLVIAALAGCNKKSCTHMKNCTTPLRY